MILTVAIPTYNRAEDLSRMLMSIQAEIHNHSLSGDVEVLVVDNCSDDNTASVCESFRAGITQFRYLRNPVNIGLTANMHKCLVRAEGEFIWTIGDDETVAPGGLLRVVRTITRHSDDIFIFNYSSEPELEDVCFLKTNHGRSIASRRDTLKNIINSK